MTATRHPTADERLRVDPIACHAHGLCAELLPELIELDEWGYPLLRPGGIPTRLRADVRTAIHHCPTLALRINSGSR